MTTIWNLRNYKLRDMQGEAKTQGRRLTNTTLCSFLFFSVGGITQPQTMKFLGSMVGKQVVVMVDSGASHNFVSRGLVGELG
ncbi:hypothetical protein F511_44479 [Dorcoceras hygrometricum]|uniref:Uncharacterized protein n=1 Tax=Dorcoceras hygrometricum TaxID=472368 RepID=A0A2Z6ZZ11_9LAMI|nr:hypothetical protein F511_44479 [Dorcoceras hygrometricum]